ncbi:MAG: lamin tail domain-containing protein [Allomuricauda sp.]|nr:MAG: lamin tail domain-containing protein [Allomuricauda sp.]
MRKVLYFLLVLVLAGCVKDKDFDPITTDCESKLNANATFADVKALYRGELTLIKEDWVIEGYVVSSDRAGNFFSVIHFQDSPNNPSEGFQIEIDLFESHLLFEPGSRVLIKIKGLYLGRSQGVFKLGGTFSGFGSIAVGRLPALKIQEHIFKACDEVVAIVPNIIAIQDLDSTMINTLVRINNLEVTLDDFGLSFAEVRQETERILKDCDGNEIAMRNSGFSDFQDEVLPTGNGSITAILLLDKKDFVLAIRDVTDLNFSNDRCPDLKQTSTQLFFTELADPNNNVGARFLELYNASEEPIDLEGWIIRRYTNDNIEVSSTIDLTGFAIDSQSTFVISPDREAFEQVYGFGPDLGVGSNSPADSNGDDNLELVDPFGNVIDRFGIPGEDGSGTNHEFEDGRAIRRIAIVAANPNYNFSEWTIYNDTGGSGTINEPKNAPEDFTPGIRQ